jgi:hypothetical protein
MLRFFVAVIITALAVIWLPVTGRINLTTFGK